MNTGYDLNNPNKYMQTAFDAFKSNQPATQQAVSQGPQAGLRYLAGLQAQAQQQQAQQTQPQALPSTTVLQQLLQKLGQNHGIMAQLPASIDIASAPTQPAMATGGLVSLAAGGPIAFSGGYTVPEPDFDEDLEGFAGGGIASIQARMEQSAAQKQANLEQWQLAQERKRARMPGGGDVPEFDPERYSEAYETTSKPRPNVPEPDFDASYNEPEEMTLEERMTRRRTPKYEPPKHEAIGPPRPTDPRTGEPIKTSGTGEGIVSRAGKAIAEHPITKGIGKIGRNLGAAGFVLDPQMWDATKAPMIIAKAATGTPLSKGEVESLTPGKSIADPMYRAANLAGAGSYMERGLEYLYDNAVRDINWPDMDINWPDTDRPETATPFVGPTKPTESPVHEPVAKAEPSAAAKQGVKAVNATEHAKQIEKRAEAPKGKEPQGAVPEEKQYEFDQHRDEYRDDHQPQGQTVSQPTDREYTPAPETSGIASVTPEDMIQHLQRLGGGGYQEDPEVAQMRSEQLESAKANKWANSIAGLIGGIYGGHSPYASENVARGIMTALGQYQAGTQAEDAIRSGIMGSKEAAQKSQAASQQHWMDKFIEAQLAKGRDQADLRRAMLSGDARLGAAEIQAKARQGAAQQRMVENALKNKQYKDAADQRLAVETAKAALRAVDEYVKNYVGIPSEADKKRVFLTVWHKLSPHIPITDEEVAGMTGSPPPTGSPGNPTATYGSSSNQISDEDED